MVTDSSGAAVPRAAVRLVNTTGNAGRTDGYGPGLISMVISILKEFSLTEGHRLEFRTEILNMFKSLVGGSQSRIVQLGLRYEF